MPRVRFRCDPPVLCAQEEAVRLLGKLLAQLNALLFPAVMRSCGVKIGVSTRHSGLSGLS
jgi:hypothetical protein